MIAEQKIDNEPKIEFDPTTIAYEDKAPSTILNGKNNPTITPRKVKLFVDWLFRMNLQKYYVLSENNPKKFKVGKSIYFGNVILGLKDNIIVPSNALKHDFKLEDLCYRKCCVLMFNYIITSTGNVEPLLDVNGVPTQCNDKSFRKFGGQYYIKCLCDTITAEDKKRDPRYRIMKRNIKKTMDIIEALDKQTEEIIVNGNKTGKFKNGRIHGEVSGVPNTLATPNGNVTVSHKWTAGETLNLSVQIPFIHAISNGYTDIKDGVSVFKKTARTLQFRIKSENFKARKPENQKFCVVVKSVGKKLIPLYNGNDEELRDSLYAEGTEIAQQILNKNALIREANIAENKKKDKNNQIDIEYGTSPIELLLNAKNMHLVFRTGTHVIGYIRRDFMQVSEATARGEWGFYKHIDVDCDEAQPKQDYNKLISSVIRQSDEPEMCPEDSDYEPDSDTEQVNEDVIDLIEERNATRNADIKGDGSK